MRAFSNLLLLTFILTLQPFAGSALDPNEKLKDPKLEAKARLISKGLRCVVCQNQSIDDSDSKLAKDLRILVRERLSAGQSSEAITDYIVSRYGDFVLLKPPFKTETLVLWLGPFLLIFIGLILLWMFFRSATGVLVKKEFQPSRLTSEEEEKLHTILDEQKND